MQPPRQAEVQNLNQPAIGQHHVLRFQVAMKDAQRMRRLQAVRNLDAHRKHQLQAGRPALDQLVQRLARHVLHHDESLIAVFAHLIDSANIRMLDRRSQPCLAQHSRAQLFGREQPGAQNLQHHRTLQQRVVGQENYAASAGAQLALNLVMLDRSSLHLLSSVPAPPLRMSQFLNTHRAVGQVLVSHWLCRPTRNETASGNDAANPLTRYNCLNTLLPFWILQLAPQFEF